MREKAVGTAVKISIYLFLLIIAYYLLDLVILQGELFEIRSLLVFFFCINCVVVGLKMFKK